jgi:hypothetical protein
LLPEWQTGIVMSGLSNNIDFAMTEAVGDLTGDHRFKSERNSVTPAPGFSMLRSSSSTTQIKLSKQPRDKTIMNRTHTFISAAIFSLAIALPTIVVSLSASGCYGPSHGTPYYGGGGGGYGGGPYYSNSAPYYSSGGSYYGSGGDYDAQHQWHDADWWRNNNPTWAREHHPEWWTQQPREQSHAQPSQREQTREQPREQTRAQPPQQEQTREQRSGSKSDSTTSYGRGNQPGQTEGGPNHD